VTDSVGGGQYSLAALLKETLDLALDGVLLVKFGPRDVLSWPPLTYSKPSLMRSNWGGGAHVIRISEAKASPKIQTKITTQINGIFNDISSKVKVKLSL
jgi:hypothetical protein